VLAFVGSDGLVTVVLSERILFRGGAEVLAAHPGLFEPQVTDPRAIRVLWVVFSMLLLVALTADFVLRV